MMKFDLTGSKARLIKTIGTALAMGVVAVVTSLNDQKQAAEYEKLRNIIEELQNK